MKRLLVTGRHGFVGGTMARLIAAEPSLGPWRMLDVPPTSDLRDASAAAALVQEEAPDAVSTLRHKARFQMPFAIQRPRYRPTSSARSIFFKRYGRKALPAAWSTLAVAMFTVAYLIMSCR